jgi:hypothetical protein
VVTPGLTHELILHRGHTFENGKGSGDTPLSACSKSAAVMWELPSGAKYSNSFSALCVVAQQQRAEKTAVCTGALYHLI